MVFFWKTTNHRYEHHLYDVSIVKTALSKFLNRSSFAPASGLQLQAASKW